MKPISFSPVIKIWYKPLPRLTSVSWPILDVNLAFKGKSLPQPIFSLIDSGASYSILHLEVAEVLGIDLKKLGPSKTGGLSVSGGYKSWILPEPIDVEIYGYSFCFSFQIIDNRNLIWPCILGENSIFNVAKIEFQRFKRFFQLSFRKDLN